MMAPKSMNEFSSMFVVIDDRSSDIASPRMTPRRTKQLTSINSSKVSDVQNDENSFHPIIPDDDEINQLIKDIDYHFDKLLGEVMFYSDSSTNADQSLFTLSSSEKSSATIQERSFCPSPTINDSKPKLQHDQLDPPLAPRPRQRRPSLRERMLQDDEKAMLIKQASTQDLLEDFPSSVDRHDSSGRCIMDDRRQQLIMSSRSLRSMYAEEGEDYDVLPTRRSTIGHGPIISMSSIPASSIDKKKKKASRRNSSYVSQQPLSSGSARTTTSTEVPVKMPRRASVSINPSELLSNSKLLKKSKSVRMSRRSTMGSSSSSAHQVRQNSCGKLNADNEDAIEASLQQLHQLRQEWQQQHDARQQQLDEAVKCLEGLRASQRSLMAEGEAEE